MTAALALESEIFSFGPYRLLPTQRRLTRGTEDVQIGGRAFDILVALVNRAGTIVTQRELIESAWPGLFVEDANLRVHIAGLRKALGDGENGAHFIETIPRRGYSFVGDVIRETGSTEAFSPVAPEQQSAARTAFRATIPAPLGRMVGREEAVSDIVNLVRSSRFVTIVGAGGLGKTTVALSAANALLDEFDHAVAFVDLSAVPSEDLVDLAIASALGVTARSNDVLPALIEFVRSRRILVLLDNCEHVVSSAAGLAERLFEEAPEFHLLATSREGLRAEGEHVYLLAPLAVPGVADDLTASEALRFPAVQLFMERAAANGHREPLSDADAPSVATICNRLDGIALALELAAGRVASLGIAGTAEQIDARLNLLWKGRRNAVPRHQTLNAVVDWSFGLLCHNDRLLLSRLSVIVGTFSLSAAQKVAAGKDLPESAVTDSLASLTEKSLLSTSIEGGKMRSRLLDMTRAYARSKLAETDEDAEISRRHAQYVMDLVTMTGGTASAESIGEARAAELIANLRAAHSWSVSEDGDKTLAVELVAGAVPVLQNLSLLRECARWCEQALSLLDESHRETAIELALWEGLASSWMFTRGNGPDVLAAIERGLGLAAQLGSREPEMRLLFGLHMFHTRSGDFRTLMTVTERAAELARHLGQPEYLVMVDWMLGTAFHLGGDQRIARRYCEAALRRSAPAGGLNLNVFGYDQRIRGLIVFIRVLWLLGFPERAASLSETVIEEVRRRDQPVAICVALIYTSTAAIWSNDFDTAAPKVEKLIACATAHAFEPYRAVGIALRGEIAAKRGQLVEGIADLRSALAIFEAENHHVVSTSALRALAEALAASGQTVEATAAIEQAITQAEQHHEPYQMPDLYRAAGEIMACGATPDLAAAEAYLRRAIDGAEEMGLLGWKLRAATALARCLAARGSAQADIVEPLEATFAQFEEGFDLPFVVEAGRLLDDLKDVRH